MAPLHAQTAENAGRPSFQSLEEAAHWYATLHADSCSDTDRQRWQQWLGQPGHAKAWEQVEAVSRKLQPLQGCKQSDGIARALQAGAKPERVRRNVIRGLFWLPVAGTVAWASWRHTPLPGVLLAYSADFHTGRGEIAEFVLEDGTRIWLNSDSALDSDYQPNQRRLHLLRGEAMVATATDPRPLFLDTRDGRMRALGTRFNVHLRPDHTTLAVYEGAVEIQPADGGTPLVVPAGWETRFDRKSIENARPTDLSRQFWTRRVLLAEDMPLRELLEELGRHHYVHFALAPEAATLRVTGTYSLPQLEQTLALLQASLPISVSRSIPWWVSIKHR